MHPQESFGFRPDELGKIVFFNRSAYNKPIKTAIFLGGMEYEAWSRAIAEASAGASADPAAGDYRELFRSASDFILPELVPGSGQFPGSLPRAVQGGKAYALADIESGASVPPFLWDPRRALAALNASLAIQTLVALERAGTGPGTEVYTEGGFRRNAGYNAILAAVLGGASRGRVFLTDISEATAFGAAMTAAAALEGGTPDALGDRFTIEYKAVRPMEGSAGPDWLADFEGYRAAWLALVGNKGAKA